MPSHPRTTNSPLTVTCTRAGPGPAFRIVTTWAALSLPTTWAGNVTPGGLTLMSAARSRA